MAPAWGEVLVIKPWDNELCHPYLSRRWLESTPGRFKLYAGLFERRHHDNRFAWRKSVNGT